MYLEKTTDLSQVKQISSRNVVSSTPRHEGNQTLNFRVTDCIGNFKSNHPTTLFLNMSKNSVFVHNNNCFIFVSLLLFAHVSSLCIDLRFFKSCLGISSAFNIYY